MADSSDAKSQGKVVNSAQRMGEGALDSLIRKALQIAESSDDADEMLKAFRLYQAVDRQKQKEAAKTRSRGAVQAARIIAPYTAIIALLVSVGTLAFQFWQVRTTEEDKETNAERTQWREALRNLSTKDDSAVFSGALGMQTFFESPQYAAQSRSSAVALLPLLGDGSEFDTVWEGMLEQTDERNQMDLVSVGRSVAAEEYELFRQITRTKFPLDRAGQRDFIDFVVDPDRPERDWVNPTNASSSAPPMDTSSKSSDSSTVSPNEFARDREHNPMKRAKASSWKIDSISAGFRYVWLNRGIRSKSLDLTGVILVNHSLDGVDFSLATPTGVLIHHASLANARFENTRVGGAKFSQITAFRGSKWDGTHWWDAECMSRNLAEYLLSQYPPKDPMAMTKAMSLVDSCE